MRRFDGPTSRGGRDGFVGPNRRSPARPGPQDVRANDSGGGGGGDRAARGRNAKPALGLMTTTLWEYPSQHYAIPGSTMQGDQAYVGATPSWVIWQLLQRYTQPGQSVLDPMCGSGTTLDVCKDMGRSGIGFDLAPRRADIRQGDARKLDLPSNSVDFVFVDPPYSTHVDYSEDRRCIGKLDALGEDAGLAYYEAMAIVIAEMARVLKPGGYLGLYVSDSFRITQRAKQHVFAPIGFELFAQMQQHLRAVDIVAVVRHNQKLERGNWHKAAEEENFFLRGFNYQFIMQKPESAAPQAPRGQFARGASPRLKAQSDASSRRPSNRGERRG